MMKQAKGLKSKTSDLTSPSKAKRLSRERRDRRGPPDIEEESPSERFLAGLPPEAPFNSTQYLIDANQYSTDSAADEFGSMLDKCNLNLN